MTSCESGRDVPLSGLVSVGVVEACLYENGAQLIKGRSRQLELEEKACHCFITRGYGDHKGTKDGIKSLGIVYKQESDGFAPDFAALLQHCDIVTAMAG